MPKQKILIMDDELGSIEAFRIILKDDYEVLCSDSARTGLKMIQDDNIQLVLLDIVMPEMDGITVLRKIREFDNDLPVVMVTATKSIKSAVEAMKLGAFDYVTKPFEVNEARLIVRKAIQSRAIMQELEYLRKELKDKYDLTNMVGESKPIKDIFAAIEKIAPTKSTVLITGESGTGKELVARALHFTSPRKNKPFVAVQCAAIPETLMESELFGYEKGAFTDATTRKTGKFELAHEGTLFLDEIGEMNPGIQAKMLRVLEQQEVIRVGGTKTVNVDVRVVAATNRDLKKAIQEGIFREDLYYRLNVMPINLPPLRDRKEDIPLLVRHFLDKYRKELNLRVKEITPAALKVLQDYPWPGNVRELKNIIERVLTLNNHSSIVPEDLPKDIYDNQPAPLQQSVPLGSSPANTLPQAVEELEKAMIIEALNNSNWVLSDAAQKLAITPRILKYKMDTLAIKGKTVLDHE